MYIIVITKLQVYMLIYGSNIQLSTIKTHIYNIYTLPYIYQVIYIVSYLHTYYSIYILKDDLSASSPPADLGGIGATC